MLFSAVERATKSTRVTLSGSKVLKVHKNFDARENHFVFVSLPPALREQEEGRNQIYDANESKSQTIKNLWKVSSRCVLFPFTHR
jgi:superfamily I DNA and RNA helicase